MPVAVFAFRLLSGDDVLQMKQQVRDGTLLKTGCLWLRPCNPNPKTSASPIEHVQSWKHKNSHYISASLSPNWALWEFRRRLLGDRDPSRYMLIFELTSEILNRTTAWHQLPAEPEFAYNCARVSSEILVHGSISLPRRGKDTAIWRLVDLYENLASALHFRLDECDRYLSAASSPARSYLSTLCKDTGCRKQKCRALALALMGTTGSGPSRGHFKPIEFEATIMSSIHCGAATTIQIVREPLEPVNPRLYGFDTIEEMIEQMQEINLNI